MVSIESSIGARADTFGTFGGLLPTTSPQVAGPGSERADEYDGLDRKPSDFKNDQGMTPVPRPRLMCSNEVTGTGPVELVRELLND